MPLGLLGAMPTGFGMPTGGGMEPPTAGAATVFLPKRDLRSIFGLFSAIGFIAVRFWLRLRGGMTRPEVVGPAAQ